MSFQCDPPLRHGPLDTIEIAQDVDCEAVLVQRVPQVFGRSQLGSVRRQERQAHVPRHDQVARLLGSGSERL